LQPTIAVPASKANMHKTSIRRVFLNNIHIPSFVVIIFILVSGFASFHVYITLF
jgi:hypothetical protein